MSDNSGIAADRLRDIIERIEAYEEQKSDINQDIKDLKAEAKAEGFDMKALAHILRLRKKSDAERQEEETILDLYKAALGM